MMTAAITAKFSRSLIRKAWFTLRPVIFAIARTDSDCLNSAVSSFSSPIASHLMQRGSRRIQRRFTPRFLPPEHSCPRFAQPLLIFRRAPFSRRNIGPRLFDRSLSFAAPLFQHPPQRLVHDDRIEHVKQS